MKACVIGAGVAGMCAVHLLNKNFPDVEIVCFEINGDVGGTWMYQDRIGVDEYGLPLTTSMYKNLRSNLPKQVMQYSDFPISEECKTFMKNEVFLDYLNDYAKNFGVKRFIKFHHIVTLVKLIEETWNVTYKDLKTGISETAEFSHIFVCNGHYSHYEIPNLKGKDVFKGSQSHSHDYRLPAPYANKKVLIVGSGPSGLDISIEVAQVADKLFLSHHRDKTISSPFPENYIQKPDVKEFTENSVIFKDGTAEEIDHVIYCTGYSYHCPFLDQSCDLTVQMHGITPLYRHVININHTSMYFIGVPQLGCAVPMIDIQVRYVMAILKGKFNLPSKDDMLKHMKSFMTARDLNRFKQVNNLHYLGKRELSYYCQMADESGIVCVPPVYCAIRIHLMDLRADLYTYRNYDLKIIDDRHFISKKIGEEKWSDVQNVFMCENL